MKEQKFKRGNLVHIAKDLGQFMSHFENDFDAIILGSYSDLYGGSNTNSYSIMVKETGNSISWYYESQMTLIDEGGEHLIVEAKKKRDEVSTKNKDLKYILSILDTGSLSSESILILFDLLGFKSSFLRNGEFFCLQSDWLNLYPVFCHIKKSDSLEQAKSIFKPESVDEWNVEATYNAFKSSVS